MQPSDPQSLPPQDLDLLSLMPLAIEANTAVATLDGLYYGVPNPDILLAPTTTQEAVRSSKIEGTQADFEDILKFEAGEGPADASLQADIQEVMNYRKALLAAGDLLRSRPFCLNTLLELHSILMDSVRGHNKGRGRFRTIQNWIGSTGCTMEEASFVPPPPENVPQHLGAWEHYWHAQTPDVITQLALLHAQFEIIHPFVDGNGRLGRMIIPLFLFEKHRLTRPSFYLSAYFESHRDEYIGCLRDLGTPGGWTRWCRFFLQGVVTQAADDTAKARAIQDLYERLKNRALEITHSQYAVPLLDYMFVHPVFRSSDVSKLEHMPTVAMVSRLFNQLREDRILYVVREGAGRRPYIYALAELINLCEGRKVF